MTDSTTTVAETVSKTPFNKKALVITAASLAAVGVVALVLRRKALSDTLETLVQDAVSDTP